MKKLLFLILLIPFFAVADVQFTDGPYDAFCGRSKCGTFATKDLCQHFIGGKEEAAKGHGVHQCLVRTYAEYFEATPEPDPIPEPEPEPTPDPIPDPIPDPLPPPTTGNYPGVPMPPWDYNSEPVNARRASGNTITFNGTADNIDYVDATGMTFNSLVTLRGQYGVLIGGDYRGLDTALEYNCNFCSVRGALISDADTGNGAIIGGGGNHFVLINSQVRGPDPSNWRLADHHCWKLWGNNIWSIGNDFRNCQGDAIQVGDQNNSPSSIRNVFIIGNHAENNQQTGFWVKNAQNVLIAYNTATNHNNGGDSGPYCGGGQYSHSNLWFLYNTCRDSKTGIKIAGTDGGSGRYFVGNDVEVNATPNPGSGSWGLGFGLESQSGSVVYSYKNKTNFMIARRAAIQSCGSEEITQTQNVGTNCNIDNLKADYKSTFGVDAPF